MAGQMRNTLISELEIYWIDLDRSIVTRYEERKNSNALLPAQKLHCLMCSPKHAEQKPVTDSLLRFKN